jgi:hypothetical protein
MHIESFWRQVRAIDAEFPAGTEFVCITSVKDPYNSLDVPGRIAEVSRKHASIRIAERKARLATYDEVQAYNSDMTARSEAVRASFVAHPFVAAPARVNNIDDLKTRWFAAITRGAAIAHKRSIRRARSIQLQVFRDRVVTRVAKLFKPRVHIASIRPGMTSQARDRAVKAILAACR